jgi:hypothetical protein
VGGGGGATLDAVILRETADGAMLDWPFVDSATDESHATADSTSALRARSSNFVRTDWASILARISQRVIDNGMVDEVGLAAALTGAESDEKSLDDGSLGGIEDALEWR